MNCYQCEDCGRNIDPQHTCEMASSVTAGFAQLLVSWAIMVNRNTCTTGNIRLDQMRLVRKCRTKIPLDNRER